MKNALLKAPDNSETCSRVTSRDHIGQINVHAVDVVSRNKKGNETLGDFRLERCHSCSSCSDVQALLLSETSRRESREGKPTDQQ